MKDRSTLNQSVALSATNHARMCGLHPRKGTIGADADIAIWDPDRKVRITQSMLHHGPDYTPYEGLEVTGWPVTPVRLLHGMGPSSRARPTLKNTGHP